LDMSTQPYYSCLISAQAGSFLLSIG